MQQQRAPRDWLSSSGSRLFFWSPQETFVISDKTGKAPDRTIDTATYYKARFLTCFVAAARLRRMDGDAAI